MGKFISSLRQQAWWSVQEMDQVGEMRRKAMQWAHALSFDETQAGNVGIVVSELASNLARHAVDGVLLVREAGWNGPAALEILAVDKGPGMDSIPQALRDGFSTIGSAGIGLGAVRRLASSLDIYSLPGVGTVIAVTVGPALEPPFPALQLGAISLPKPGQELCGDAWAVWQWETHTRILVVDGLGHGDVAAEAAREAVQTFRDHPGYAPAALIEACHQRMRHTRGAAMAVADIQHDARELIYAGVGNIAGRLYAEDTSRGLVSFSGTVGLSVRKIKELSFPMPEGAVLIMASDGVSNRWQFEKYPGLLGRRAGTIAARLLYDFRRETDDSTVLVGRWATDRE